MPRIDSDPDKMLLQWLKIKAQDRLELNGVNLAPELQKLIRQIEEQSDESKTIRVESGRHIEFYEDRTVRAGVILQIGGTSIAMSGIEFFNLLKAAKSYGRDWGAGDRPNRADIREAIRVLKSGGGR